MSSVTAPSINLVIDNLVTDLFDASLGITNRTLITSESKDADIIYSIIHGCRENYTFLVNRYYEPIFNYLLRSVNFHTQTSQDLVSETFFKAYLNLNRFNSNAKNAKFSSWLYKIAHNILIDYYRSFKQTQTHAQIDTINDDPSSREIVQKLTSDAMEINIKSSELLSPVLNSLRSEERQLLLLFYIEQLSVQEIADIYNVFPNTIKTRLHRARSKAKKIVLKHTDNLNGTFVERVESFMHNVSSTAISSVFKAKPGKQSD